jgi:hypothetical protein
MACTRKKCESSHPDLLKAARSYYEAQRDEAIAVLNVYFTNSVAIADHSNFLDEIKSWTCKLSEAEECLEVLGKHWE